MGNERLERALARIEKAADALSEIDAGKAGAEQADTGPPREDFEAALAERDRTIAKLRADLVDISKLKDEEIERLRGALEAQSDAQGGSGDSAGEAETGGDPALQAKYDRLESQARKTLAELDALIAKAEGAADG